MNKDDSRIGELTVALEKAERRLADRETLLNAAIGQAETARAQSDQAHERAESLRRRLASQEEQWSALLSQLKQAGADLAARDLRIAELQRELQQRDDAIAELRRVYDENDNALLAINEEAKRHNPAQQSEQISALGMVLEPLDELGSRHRIERATTTIGRAAANDIRINSTSVSRYHARIVVQQDTVYLIDLQSTNGCSVNGERITRQAITDADLLAIGDAKFRLSFGLPRADGEDRSMDETFPLLNDSAILIPKPKSKSKSKPAEAGAVKPKTQS